MPVPDWLCKGTLNRGKDRREGNKEVVNCPCKKKKVTKELGFDPTDFMKSGKSGLKNPPGFQWHHPEDPLDEVWLVTTCDHRRHHKKQKCGGISIGGGK